jgi:hypothetical protein
MKYIVLTTKETEIEIEFPYFTKDGAVYYSILSPSKTIVLYANSNSIDTYISVIGAEHEPIRESEYMNVFHEVMGNILKDLKL